MVFPVYIKMRVDDTYMCIFEDQESMTITFYKKQCSVHFGETEDSITNESLAIKMLEIHQEITMDQFNEKIKLYAEQFNTFVNSKGKLLQYKNKQADYDKQAQEEEDRKPKFVPLTESFQGELKF